uniref:PITH domain-containing protein 1 n=1 Tax=Phallusia mammillata TaxID=59560 RepID=A0A6F9DP40_9ASCI|nr:PITH domain-containing protein 1 [Phallusia mammillata]
MCDHDHNHDHSHEQEDQSAQFSLYIKINLSRVECLNELEENSGKSVFKPWDERLNHDKFVESDADPELLFNIPFTGNVKLKSVALLGGENNTHPKSMKLFKNIPNMNMDQTSKSPDQTFELPQTYNDVLQLPVKIARFSNVNCLSIFFPENYGSDSTKIYYIGLTGDFTQAQRQEIMITNYELAANPADHKQDLYQTSGHMIQ